MIINKEAMKESLSDTFIATIINFPLNWFLISVAFYVKMNALETYRGTEALAKKRLLEADAAFEAGDYDKARRLYWNSLDAVTSNEAAKGLEKSVEASEAAKD